MQGSAPGAGPRRDRSPSACCDSRFPPEAIRAEAVSLSQRKKVHSDPVGDVQMRVSRGEILSYFSKMVNRVDEALGLPARPAENNAFRYLGRRLRQEPEFQRTCGPPKCMKTGASLNPHKPKSWASDLASFACRGPWLCMATPAAVLGCPSQEPDSGLDWEPGGLTFAGVKQKTPRASPRWYSSRTLTNC